MLVDRALCGANEALVDIGEPFVLAIEDRSACLLPSPAIKEDMDIPPAEREAKLDRSCMPPKGDAVGGPRAEDEKGPDDG